MFVCMCVCSLMAERYMPMQLVAPSAVSIADAIEAISCTMNFTVSFFVMSTKRFSLPVMSTKR